MDGTLGVAGTVMIGVLVTVVVAVTISEDAVPVGVLGPVFMMMGSVAVAEIVVALSRVSVPVAVLEECRILRKNLLGVELDVDVAKGMVVELITALSWPLHCVSKRMKALVWPRSRSVAPIEVDALPPSAFWRVSQTLSFELVAFDPTTVVLAVDVAATVAPVEVAVSLDALMDASTSVLRSAVSCGINVLVGFFVSRSVISVARRAANVAWSSGFKAGVATASCTDSPIRFHG